MTTVNSLFAPLGPCSDMLELAKAVETGAPWAISVTDSNGGRVECKFGVFKSPFTTKPELQCHHSSDIGVNSGEGDQGFSCGKEAWTG